MLGSLPKSARAGHPGHTCYHQRTAPGDCAGLGTGGAVLDAHEGKGRHRPGTALERLLPRKASCHKCGGRDHGKSRAADEPSVHGGYPPRPRSPPGPPGARAAGPGSSQAPGWALRKGAPFFVWGTWALALLSALAFLVNYARDVPYYDELGMVPVLTGTQPVSLRWLWSEHNGHRLPVPRLIL